jgi:hypothetical protein
MTLTKVLETSNKSLAREFGYTPPGLPKMRWGFSEPGRYEGKGGAPLWVIAPVYNVDGEMIFDYYCACGKNRELHLAHCGGLTLPRARMEKQKCVPFLENLWLLGTWLEPPNEEEWIGIDGTLDSYPRQGTYVPFQINGKYVNLHEDKWPEIPVKTDRIITAMKDFIAQRKAMEQVAKEKEELRDWTPDHRPNGTLDLRDSGMRGGPRGSKHNQFYMHLRDKMTQFGQIPGTKGNVSWGGSPEVESPNVRKDKEKLIIP